MNLTARFMLLLLQNATFPDTLPQICDSMATNGSICQGVVYSSSSKTAYFKGTVPGSHLSNTQTCASLQTSLPGCSPQVTCTTKNLSMHHFVQLP